MEILHRDNWGGMPRMRALALVLIVGSVAAESLPEISDLRMEIQRENRLMTELLDNMDGLGTRLSSRVDALHARTAAAAPPCATIRDLVKQHASKMNDIDSAQVLAYLGSVCSDPHAEPFMMVLSDAAEHLKRLAAELERQRIETGRLHRLRMTTYASRDGSTAGDAVAARPPKLNGSSVAPHEARAGGVCDADDNANGAWSPCWFGDAAASMLSLRHEPVYLSIFLGLLGLLLWPGLPNPGTLFSMLLRSMATAGGMLGTRASAMLKSWTGSTASATEAPDQMTTKNIVDSLRAKGLSAAEIMRNMLDIGIPDSECEEALRAAGFSPSPSWFAQPNPDLMY